MSIMLYVLVGLAVLYLVFFLVLDWWIHKTARDDFYDVWPYSHSRLNNKLSSGQLILFKSTIFLYRTVVIVAVLIAMHILFFRT